MAGKFRVRFVNFNYYAQDEFDTLEAAVAYANSKGFEVAVEKDGGIVASKTTFGGWEGLYQRLEPRTFSEIRKGDVILFNKDFRKVAEVLRSDENGTDVAFDDGGLAELDGLVYTKGAKESRKLSQ